MKSPLYRAFGGAVREKLVWDFTLGLGFDAFECARMGARVVAWERSPQVFQKWKDAVARAQSEPKLSQVLGRIEGRLGDAREAWKAEAVTPDFVVLDPMFPEAKNQTQRRRKEMEFLRSVVGDDLDAEALLGAALATGASRVLVKRPLRAPELASPNGLPPTHSVSGKSHRFDIWQPR